jgi:tRNA-specific 2-thiouridylase
MRLYDASGTTAAVGRCCGPRDIEDARRVCKHLDIPFYVVDFEADFQSAVVDDFVDSYLAGETPNPCVRCNQHIKFTPLLKRARALGADRLITGHYARLEHAGDRVVLRRGVDGAKDQSYFLFSMPLDELGAVEFPLGRLSKDEVRELATSYGLPNANKKDSQEICFVPDGDYAGFVERAATARKLSLPVAGDILDREGKVVGQHGGIHRFTVGQRKGLGDVSIDGKPVYVLAVDRARNTVTVGPRDAAGTSELTIADVRWFTDTPTAPLETTIQVRYRSPPVPATVSADGKLAKVTLSTEVIASAGQAAVFHEGDTVVGGGWIASS